MTPVDKSTWRAWVIAGRRAVTADQRAAEAAALVTHVVTLVTAGQTICAYVPVGSEPGSLDLLDALAAKGAEVLLPIAREPGALRWAHYLGRDDLVAAPFGLREPTSPILAAHALADAALVLVPALAVDRRGVRLGRGAGFYDRTLTLTTGRIVAVVRDDELVDTLPEDPHDQRVHAALTPGNGLVTFGPE